MRVTAFVVALAISSLTLPGLACAVDTDGPMVGRVTVTGDQMHQLDIAPAKTKAFATTKSAIARS